MGATRRTRAHHVRSMVVVGAIGVWAVWMLVVGQGDVLVGLGFFSLIAIPFAIMVIAVGRHSQDVGGFLGGKDLYDGHGPEERHRRR